MKIVSNKLRLFITLARLTVIFSIIGCVYQLIDITFEYFKKETVTEIKIKNARQVVLPAISICSRLPYFVDFDKLSTLEPGFVKLLQEEYPFVNSSETYSKLMITSDGYTYMFTKLAELLNLNETGRVLYSWDDIVHKSMVIAHNDFGYLNDSQISEHCDVTLYAMEMNACFRFDCTKNGRYVITSKDLRRSEFKEDIALFYIHQNMFSRMKYFHVYLHSPRTFPSGQYSPMVILKALKYASIHYVTYKRYETQLLPAPYESDCKDYATSGYNSRQNGLQTCENDLSLKLVNAPFFGNTHTFNLNAKHGFQPYYIYYDNQTIRSIMNEIQETCGDQFTQPNCGEEFFIPKAMTPRKYIGNYTQLMILWPTEPDIIVDSKAKLPFSEFIILIESVFGTWFGFCFAGSLPTLYRMALRTPKVKYSKVPVESIKNTLIKPRLSLRVY